MLDFILGISEVKLIGWLRCEAIAAARSKFRENQNITGGFLSHILFNDYYAEVDVMVLLFLKVSSFLEWDQEIGAWILWLSNYICARSKKFF